MPQSPTNDDSLGEPPCHWLSEPAPCPSGQRLITVENPYYQHTHSLQSAPEQQRQEENNLHPHSLERPHRIFYSGHLSSSRLEDNPSHPHRFSQCKQKSLKSCHRREVAERSPVPLLAHLLKGNNFVPISQRLGGDQSGGGQLIRQPLRDRNCFPANDQQSIETQLGRPIKPQSGHPNSQHSVKEQLLKKTSSTRPLAKSVSCHLPSPDFEPPQLPPKVLVGDLTKKPKLRHTRTFTLTRGAFGYGFLLSGECPTIIGSVAKGCPAQEAGLRSGDVVLKVNESYVANSSHDEIVTLVGSSLDPLRLTISDPDPGQDAQSRQERLSHRRSLCEGKRRSGTTLASDCDRQKSSRRRKVGFEPEGNPANEVLLSSEDEGDLGSEKGSNRNQVRESRNQSRRRKSAEKLSSQQSKQQSNYRNLNLSFSVDKKPRSSVECQEGRSSSPRSNMHRQSTNETAKAISRVNPIMDKSGGENKENVILRVDEFGDKRTLSENNNRHVALPTKSTSQVKLAKKASLTSLSSLTERSSSQAYSVSEFAPDRTYSDSSISQQQQLVSANHRQRSTSRPPSQSSNPPPVPPHRNLSSQSNPSADSAEFQPPRSLSRRPRPSSIQLDPCHENFPLEDLAPLYFSDGAGAATQRNSYAGEALAHRSSQRQQYSNLPPPSSSGENRSRPHSSFGGNNPADFLGTQSSADDIRRSMNKLYPRLLQQDTNAVAPSPLVRSQSVRGASKAIEGERKVHLYEEVASDEEEGAMSGRSPGKRVTDLRNSPLIRSVSHSHEGSAAGSFNDVAQDDSGIRGFQPESFNQICRREASETILDSAMKGDDDDSTSEVGRAASWATKFERLLADPLGVAMFRDFLQKEFSDENMRFYLTVESYKFQSPPLDKEARRIYDTFLAPDALDSVNVDAGGVARVSEAINGVIVATIFDDAQAQIFKLMKFDCYARFLKSEAYKSAVVAEMEGRPIQATLIGDVHNLAKASNNLPANPLDSANSGGIGRKSDFSGLRPPKSMTKDGKIRHSLMPWNKGKTRDSKIPKLRKSFGGKKDAVNVVKKDVGSERKKPFFASRSDVLQSAVEKRKAASSTSTFQRIRRSLGSSRESLGSLGASRESLSVFSGEKRERDASTERSASEGVDAEGNRKDKKAVFRIDLPNQSKSLEIKARYTKPMGDIIDPLFAKYKFSTSISDVFLFNAATNSIYGRTDYEILNAGVFHNQRILISIRGHHRQHSNSQANSRRDALVHDEGIATAGGGVGAEVLSRVAASDRYDDQRGPLTAADLEIPDWLNPPSAEPSPRSLNGEEIDKNDSMIHGLPRDVWRGRKLGSRYGSASSLSVKSGVGLDDGHDFTGSIPSPDLASALFADAMGHAPDASLGDSKTRIDLGLGDVNSPEMARGGAKTSSSADGIGSCFWRDDDAFLDETLGDGDRTMTADFTLPDDIQGCSGDLGRERVSDGSISLYKSIDVADASLPSLGNHPEEALNREMRNLSVFDGNFDAFGNDTLVEQSLFENTFVENSILDNTLVDNSVFESTKIEDQSAINDGGRKKELFVDSFVSEVDDTFHDMDKSALTTTFTDVSQLSALSSLPSAPSSSGSDESASDVEKLETFL